MTTTAFWKSAWRPEVNITGSGMTPPAHGRTDQRTLSVRSQIQSLIKSLVKLFAACLWRGIFKN